MTRHLCLLTLICAVVLAVPASSQEKGPLHGAYDLVPNWLKPVEDNVFIHATSVHAESPDRIFIAMSGVTSKAAVPPGFGGFDRKVSKAMHQLYVVNRNGEIVERWSQWEDRFGSAHKVAISPYDPARHVWVLNRGSQEVLKFTNDGKKLVMALGTRGVPGKDDKHFAQPSDITWLPDGTFFIADGDIEVTGPTGLGPTGRAVALVNTRVVKFDRDGKYLTAWDTGTPGQANHGIAVDAQRRVYITERGPKGGRVTIWDENGKRLDVWEMSGSPDRISVTQDGFVWISIDDGLAKFDRNGKRLYHFVTAGDLPDTSTPHDFTVDSEGSLIVQPSASHVIHKYVPKSGADRNQLVGRRLGAGTGTR